jgi:hypothetical protein
MMILILSDVFRRRDISGWGKAAWIVFLIILPFVGVARKMIIVNTTSRNGWSAAITMSVLF